MSPDWWESLVTVIWMKICCLFLCSFTTTWNKKLRCNSKQGESHIDIFIPVSWIIRDLEIYSTPGAEVTCPWLLLFKQLPPMWLPFTNFGPQGLQLGTTRPSAGLSQLPKIVPHYTPQGLADITAASRKLHQVMALPLHFPVTSRPSRLLLFIPR